MRQRLPDGDDGVGRHHLPRRHPRRRLTPGPDDRLLPDLDEVLVVDRPLREDDAGAAAHPTEATTTRVVRADGAEFSCRLPRRMDEARQRPPQRAGNRADPGHVGMVGGAGQTLRPRSAARASGGRPDKLALCSPFHRTAAPIVHRRRSSEALTAEGVRLDRRQFFQFSAFGAAGLAMAAQPEEATGPPRARPGPAPPPQEKQPAVVNAKLASGVVIPTAPWLIAENAKRGTLNWVCSHVQPDHALEGFPSQVSAVARGRRRAVREHDCTGGAGPGLSDGLLPGTRWPTGLAERHGQGGTAAAPGRHGRHRHRDAVRGHPP